MIYMDYNATTPILPEVVEEMLRYMPFKSDFGNASSVHQYGRAARLAVENAREIIAAVIGAEPDEIIFTSGGTEANNLAIKGVMEGAQGVHAITSKIEHHAVLRTCEGLTRHWWALDHVNVDKGCLVDLDHLRELKNWDWPTPTILVTIMWANNETGTIQPMREIAMIARDRGALLHTDAVQAFGKIAVHVNHWPIDLMSLSAHKVYGPKGVGALYVKKGTRINPLIVGGHQERDMRAGTENVPGIVGFGKAVQIAEVNRKRDWERYAGLTAALITRALGDIPHTWVNGGGNRLANTVNLGFKGVDSEALLLMLDNVGIAASSGAACESGSVEPSHVLKAMGLSDEDASSSVRFSIGRYTKREDIEIVITALKDIIPKLRSIAVSEEAAMNAISESIQVEFEKMQDEKPEG